MHKKIAENRLFPTVIVTFLSLLGALSARAEDPDPFAIDLGPAAGAVVPAGTPGAGASLAPRSAPSGPAVSSSAIQNLNPDISFLGDFLGGNQAALNERGGPLHRPVYLREVELDGVGYVSPYAKAFFVASFDEGGVSIEEAFMHFTELPADLSLRLGKMYVDTDTVGPLHQHAIPFVDRPLAWHHILGGDGLKEVGANLSWLVPNPWDHFIQLSGMAGVNLADGDQYSAFYGGNLQSPLYSLRLGTSWDLFEASYINVNVSEVAAPLPDHSVTTVYVADALVRYAPNPVSNSVSLLNGYIFNRGNPNQTGSFDAKGYYNYLGWQFSPRWRIGARHDWVTDPTFGGTERQYTGILSFYPTETNYLRFQYGKRHLTPDDGSPEEWEDRIWLQLNFSLGPHQAHTAL